MDIADSTYLNAHYVVTLGALVWIYLRRNDSFYFVRNMFMVAMVFALVGYAVYPTAPPRLMPQWGFTDSIQQFTGVTVEHGPSSALLNLYAAIPSMHVCFALMIGWPMARLVNNRAATVAWAVYPAVHHLRRDRDRKPLPHRRRAGRRHRAGVGAAGQAAAGPGAARRVGVRAGARLTAYAVVADGHAKLASSPAPAAATPPPVAASRARPPRRSCASG